MLFLVFADVMNVRRIITSHAWFHRLRRHPRNEVTAGIVLIVIQPWVDIERRRRFIWNLTSHCFRIARTTDWRISVFISCGQSTIDSFTIEFYCKNRCFMIIPTLCALQAVAKLCKKTIFKLSSASTENSTCSRRLTVLKMWTDDDLMVFGFPVVSTNFLCPLVWIIYVFLKYLKLRN